MKIPFIDLQAEYVQLRDEINAAVARVLQSGWYILGEEVERFEQEFAAYCQVPYAVGVASGTDAIALGLRALGVEPGDEVITVSHTAVATVAAIELSGATPVFVDVDPVTYTMDPLFIELAITGRTRAIVPVHLYGQPADMNAIRAIAQRHNLLVLEDCAQAHGARYQDQPVGSFGDAAAFSFYPTKNLGAIGDGGAVVSDRPDVAERLRLLRQYGWRRRYISEIAGANSRLDELQAAVLRVKLGHLDRSNAARRQRAQRYAERLAGLPVTLPQRVPPSEHVYHLFVVESDRRDELRTFLSEQGIGTAVHYPVPVHRQPAYRRLGYGRGRLPITERLAGRILSLPLYPTMPMARIEAVASAVATFFAATAATQRFSSK